MKRSPKLRLFFIPGLLLAGALTNSALAQGKAQIFEQAPGGVIFQQLEQVQPQIAPGVQGNKVGTVGVAEYQCDSQKNVCTCKGVTDCQTMVNDKVCAKDNICDDYGCTCTWR